MGLWERVMGSGMSIDLYGEENGSPFSIAKLFAVTHRQYEAFFGTIF